MHLKDSNAFSVVETTAITPGPLYFAYGSNLSYTQMQRRCSHNPTLSSKPVAIARLDKWRWLIAQTGYANVLPPPELRIGQQATEGDEVPVSGDEDAVFGVLYEMDPADEVLLDGYEGVDYSAPRAAPGGKIPISIRPREQARGDYGKWYVSATITEWLDDEQRAVRLGAAMGDEESLTQQAVLVYVDEKRVRLAPPKDEYIGRMNRAIREAESIGFPKPWADEVMRKSIPLN